MNVSVIFKGSSSKYFCRLVTIRICASD